MWNRTAGPVVPILLVLAAACSRQQDVEITTDCLGRPLPLQPYTGTAHLTWDAPTTKSDGSPLNDLAGYRINYGLAPDQLSCQVEIRDPEATSGTVTGLSPGTWHFAVVSFDSGFVESEPSETVSRQID